MKHPFFVTAAALLLPVLFFLGAFVIPPQYEDTFVGALVEKCDLLADTPSPRIVLIGGSAAAFGVDSEALEGTFDGYHVVNFGLYAGLGTRVMLELALPDIREKDIVIVMPEQNAQTLSGYVGYETLLQATDGRPSLLLRLEETHWPKLLSVLPSFAAAKARAFFTGTHIATSGAYARSVFTPWGDVSSPLCENNIMPGGVDADMTISFDASLMTIEFVDAFNRFADAAAKKGAQVFYHLPPMNRATADETSPDEFADFLFSALHAELLGNPNHALLDSGWFYDTNFHLNNAGKQLFTRQLARDLRAMMGDSRPVSITVPAMPALRANTENIPADNGDADCFTYEVFETYAVVTGLTEKGQSREQLTVPATIDGLPVSVIQHLGDAPRLEAITLQTGVSQIYGGAFSACPRLREICLEHTAPESCRVNAALLDGTQAVVKVRADVLASFRVSYFWAELAGRIEAWE